MVEPAFCPTGLCDCGDCIDFKEGECQYITPKEIEMLDAEEGKEKKIIIDLIDGMDDSDVECLVSAIQRTQGSLIKNIEVE